MKAMIFAAGLGTRLKPLTDTLPKALVPVCGQPLLYHVIKRLRDAGADEIVVNVHHFADKIENYLAENDFGIKISVSDERNLLLETGGAIRHAAPLLASESGDGYFLVHNVDIVSDMDLGALMHSVRNDALAVLPVSERETRRYFLFDDDMRLVGWTDTSTGEIRSPYRDIDADACRKYAFTGIHLISEKIFSAFGRYGFGERFPIVDFYLRACADYPVYGRVQKDLTLVDVGKAETLSEAERVCSRIL